MIVFKTFLKVLNRCKVPIIMYTVFLIFFGGFNISTSDHSTNFVSEKPDILIINHDEKQGITKDLINYIEKNSNIIKIDNNKEAIEDAIFYRDVNYVIIIPDNFRKDFLNHLNPEIKVKSTGDYQASLADMILKRYLKVANTYNEISSKEEEIITYINDTLKNKVKVKMTSKLDSDSLDKASFYYNFSNYCILAGSIYVICLVLSSFKEEKIKKRTIISSMKNNKFNWYLLLSNSLFTIVLWLFYVILSFILVGKVMFTLHGLIYILNSFIFSLCSLTIAFLLGNTVKNKEAINGIVNVIALGSSFLCGAFVPMEMLPNSVINIAHFLPSYWYIKTNELTKTIEVFNFDSIKPILINMGIIFLFTIGFIILTNIITKKKNSDN